MMASSRLAASASRISLTVVSIAATALVCSYRPPLSMFTRAFAPNKLALIRCNAGGAVLPASLDNNDEQSMGTRPSLDTFDFSSRVGWDEFYASSDEFDWHHSISHSSILSEIEPGSSVLMVGCGTSTLPDFVYDAHGTHTRICCLDYSAACVEAMQRRYRSAISGQEREGQVNGMTFIHADATRLDAVEWDGVLVGQGSSKERTGIDVGGKKHFDAVVDKGLIDALMCGEGWDGDIARLFHGVSGILKEDKGVYVLISFKLSKSSKEFLSLLGEEYGMQWEFDLLEKSNDKVSVSRAIRQKEKGAVTNTDTLDAMDCNN